VEQHLENFLIDFYTLRSVADLYFSLQKKRVVKVTSLVSDMNLLNISRIFGKHVSNLRVNNSVTSLFRIAVNERISFNYIVVLSFDDADHLFNIAYLLKNGFLSLFLDNQKFQRSDICDLTISESLRRNLNRQLNFYDVLVFQQRLKQQRAEDALSVLQFYLDVYEFDVLPSCGIELVLSVGSLMQLDSVNVLLKAQVRKILLEDRRDSLHPV